MDRIYTFMSNGLGTKFLFGLSEPSNGDERSWGPKCPQMVLSCENERF